MGESSAPAGEQTGEVSSVDGRRPARLTWVDHPARRRPLALVFATATILAASLAVLWSDGGALLALVSSGVLVGSIAGFLLPTRYTLTASGVHVERLGHRRVRAWDELRRWEEDAGGFFLGTLAQPHRLLDGRRGVWLRGGDREIVRALLRERLGPPWEERHGGR